MRLLFTLVALFTLSFTEHPIHVSVCDTELDRQEQRLEMTMRLFVDDVEIQIRKELGNESLDILNPPAPETTDQLMKPYLEKHLALTIDGKKSAYKYLGHEVEGGSIFCYLMVSGVSDLKKIGAFNDILLDTFDDQVNLIHVEVDGETHTMMFRKGQVNQELTF